MANQGPVNQGADKGLFEIINKNTIELIMSLLPFKEYMKLRLNKPFREFLEREDILTRYLSQLSSAQLQRLILTLKNQMRNQSQHMWLTMLRPPLVTVTGKRVYFPDPEVNMHQELNSNYFKMHDILASKRDVFEKISIKDYISLIEMIEQRTSIFMDFVNLGRSPQEYVQPEMINGYKDLKNLKTKLGQLQKVGHRGGSRTMSDWTKKPLKYMSEVLGNVVSKTICCFFK